MVSRSRTRQRPKHTELLSPDIITESKVKAYDRMPGSDVGDLPEQGYPIGNSYINPENSYTDPRNSYIDPRNSYIEPGNSYIDPRNSYIEPGNSYIDPGDSYIDQGGAYISLDGDNACMDPAPAGGNDRANIIFSDGYSTTDRSDQLFSNPAYNNYDNTLTSDPPTMDSYLIQEIPL